MNTHDNITDDNYVINGYYVMKYNNINNNDNNKLSINSQVKLLLNDGYKINFSRLANIMEYHYFLDVRNTSNGITLYYHSNNNLYDYYGSCPYTNIFHGEKKCSKNCDVIKIYISENIKCKFSYIIQIIYPSNTIKSSINSNDLISFINDVLSCHNNVVIQSIYNKKFICILKFITMTMIFITIYMLSY